MKKLLVVPAAAFALALSLSACGDSKGDSGGTPVSSPSAGASAPATAGGGTITGNDGGGSEEGKLTPAQREALTKARDCMLQKGYDMPELDPDNPVMAPKDNNGKSDAQVNEDAAECATQSQPTGG